MSIHDTNGASEFNSKLPSSTGLTGINPNQLQDIFGQPLIKEPTALPLNRSLAGDETFSEGDNAGIDHLTGLPVQEESARSIYGDEFESGLPLIDDAVYFTARTLNAVDKAVESAIESSAPIVKEALYEVASQTSEGLKGLIDTARLRWNAPDNEIQQTLTQQTHQILSFLKEEANRIANEPDVIEATKSAERLGNTLLDKARNAIHTARSRAEVWMDDMYGTSYLGMPLNIDESDGGDRPNEAFTGFIDTGFETGDHGTEVVHTFRDISQDQPDWLSATVGTGTWSVSLVEFVDAARASGQEQAVINLSFDLTQTDSAGVTTTRFELTPEEHAALSYAQDNGVIIVASAGNEAGVISALGQASQEYDNIITVGAVENGQRAHYSSFGRGLSLVAPGDGRGEVEGTSLATARVSAAISQVWETNPNLNHRQVINILKMTATDLGEEGWDADTAFGLLNLEGACSLAQSTIENPNLIPNAENQQTVAVDNILRGVASQPLGMSISSERPTFSDRLGNLANSAKQFLQEEVVQPIANRIPESLKDTASSAGDVIKSGVEVVVDAIKDPVDTAQDVVESAVDTVQDTVSDARDTVGGLVDDVRTEAQALSYPGYVFKYEPGQPMVEDPYVRKWQERMIERGWGDIIEKADGYYGPRSAEAARQFQDQQGLDVDGIVGIRTWIATFSTRNETDDPSQATSGELPGGISGTHSSQVFKYEPGQTLTYNSDVERWQAQMRERGWDITVDGFFGPQSAEVARQFQQEQGLVVDGIVGIRTWESAFNNSTIIEPTPPLSPREEFEQFPESGQSTSWSIPVVRPEDDRSTLRTTTATNGAEVGLASQQGYEVVYLEGHLLDKIKQDPAMETMQQNLIESIRQDPRYNRESFTLNDYQGVQFGGERWEPEEETQEDWLSHRREENPILHLSTWQVGIEELTWVLRHATVKYWANVSSSGEINIEYSLYDTLDLSPRPGRSEAYNRISQVLGTGYHRIAGGNMNMQTRAQWEVTV